MPVASSVASSGPKSIAQGRLGALDRRAEQPLEPRAVDWRERDGRKPPRGAAKMDRDHHLAQVRLDLA